MTDNTNAAELLRLLGAWHAIAARLGFPPCTGPAEVLRALEARQECADHLADAVNAVLLTTTPERRTLDALRAALVDYRPYVRTAGNPAWFRDAVAVVDTARNRRLAATLADEHAKTQAASARLAARIDKLESLVERDD